MFLDLTPLKNALQSLDLALSKNKDEFIRDSVIQRFEFTYELAWKSMFYWMRDQGEKVPEMQKPIIQAAFRCELIVSPEIWEEMKDQRDETSHTYNEAKAVSVSALVLQLPAPYLAPALSSTKSRKRSKFACNSLLTKPPNMAESIKGASTPGNS
jgi:nucleotidyltransferase substrate binding protein (TIGR01987 family)